MPDDSIAGVVLAAGLGTRLRPLTDLRPKALCPVANEPLLDGAIARVRCVAADVAVNAHAHADQIVRHLAPARPAVHVEVERDEPLGTAGALANLRSWIAGRGVIVHNADAWIDADIGEFGRDWDGERIRLLVVHRPDRAPDFGRWTFAGVSLLPWDAIEPLEPKPSGLWEVVLADACEQGAVDLVPHDGHWFDCGTPSSYLAANLAASGGKTVVGDGATVDGEAVRCVVWPGAVVHAGERLVECVRAITEDGRDVTVDAKQ